MNGVALKHDTAAIRGTVTIIHKVRNGWFDGTKIHFIPEKGHKTRRFLFRGETGGRAARKSGRNLSDVSLYGLSIIYYIIGVKRVSV